MRPHPRDFDLTRPTSEIAAEAGVTLQTVRQWKNAGGISTSRPGNRKGRWQSLTQTDWSQGASHVARLMGVTQAAAWNQGFGEQWNR